MEHKGPQDLPVWLWSMTLFDDWNNDEPRTEGEQKEEAELAAPWIAEALSKFCKKWVFQAERTPTTGRLHYQIQINLIAKCRQGALLRELKGTILEGAHVSRTSNNGERASFSYCLKAKSRVAGPWADNDTKEGDDPHGWMPSRLSGPPHPSGEGLDRGGRGEGGEEKALAEPDDIKGKVLRVWQEAIRVDLAVPCTDMNQRWVNVLVDPTGCLGKTTLVKWLSYRKLACFIPPYVRVDNIMAAALDGNTAGYKSFIIDLPRGMSRLSKTASNEIYLGIENLKNGFAYDWRHKNRQVIFSNPKVWVFTNTAPPLGHLSADRWKLWLVNPATLGLVHYTPAREAKLRAYGEAEAERKKEEAAKRREELGEHDHCEIDDFPDINPSEPKKKKQKATK